MIVYAWNSISVPIFCFLMKKFRKILLVDDDETSNFLTQLVIEEMNLAYDVIVKVDGASALQFLRENCLVNGCVIGGNCPDLILLDINMPIMSGLEVLEELLKIGGENLTHTHVVMLTSSIAPKDVEAATRLGVRAYLDKPLTEEKVYALLGEQRDSRVRLR